jgi:hypothetical protein
MHDHFTVGVPPSGGSTLASARRANPPLHLPHRSQAPAWERTRPEAPLPVTAQAPRIPWAHKRLSQFPTARNFLGTHKKKSPDARMLALNHWRSVQSGGVEHPDARPPCPISKSRSAHRSSRTTLRAQLFGQSKTTPRPPRSFILHPSSFILHPSPKSLFQASRQFG